MQGNYGAAVRAVRVGSLMLAAGGAVIPATLAINRVHVRDLDSTLLDGDQLSWWQTEALALLSRLHARQHYSVSRDYLQISDG